MDRTIIVHLLFLVWGFAGGAIMGYIAKKQYVYRVIFEYGPFNDRQTTETVVILDEKLDMSKKGFHMQAKKVEERIKQQELKTNVMLLSYVEVKGV